MGHDTHFLSRLTRVSDADVDLAMSLYRDVPLVRSVVEAAPVPEDVTRVAIALDASDTPPLVLVERSGKFVTCLAPGMKTDLPIISRAALDRALRVKQESERTKEVLVRYDAVWRKPASMFHSCEQVDLEAMEMLLVSAPLCTRETIEFLNDCATSIHQKLLTLMRRERVRPRETPLLELFWKLNWVSSHYMVIAATGLRAQPDQPELLSLINTYALLIGHTQFHPWVLRVVWACAHLGKPMLPLLKEVMTSPEEFDRSVPALALATMALGHRKLEGEIRKLLERYDGRLDCRGLLPLLDDPEAHVGVALKFAGELGIYFTSHLPIEDPASFVSEEEVPAEYALALLARAPFSKIHQLTRPTLLGALPLLARARPQDFYVPHAVVSRWQRLDCVAAMTRIVETEIRLSEPATPAASNAPGRNEPCQCGSGRKYKKCCAA